MAKVKGPLFSVQSSGKLGKSIIYRNCRGTSFVTGYHKPTGKKQSRQHVMREAMRVARQLWRDLPEETKQHFNVEAQIKCQLPGYNLYIQQYLTGTLERADIYYGTNRYGRGIYL